MLAQHGTGTAATRLTDGRVLVTGGELTDSGATASDVYDPAAGSWTSAGAPGGNRSLHTSTLLPSGQVLLAGSFGNSGLIASLFTAPTTLTGENLNLGNQTLGTTRPPTSVHITNTGTVPLLMRDVAVAGANAADFALVSDGCSGAPVAAGAACTLQIAFTPAAAGPRAAAVSFRANTPDTPHSFTLAGTGIATPTPTPDATPDATPVPVAAVPQPPAPATAPAAKPQLFATLAFTFKAGTRTTRLTSLTVQHVAKGATVAVKCPKGCAKKTFLKRNASGTVSLKTLVTKPLKVGTTLTVTVTKVGSSGLTKTLKIRSRRAPSVATKLGAL
jgi:hypothetical protein